MNYTLNLLQAEGEWSSSKPTPGCSSSNNLRKRPLFLQRDPQLLQKRPISAMSYAKANPWKPFFEAKECLGYGLGMVQVWFRSSSSKECRGYGFGKSSVNVFLNLLCLLRVCEAKKKEDYLTRRKQLSGLRIVNIIINIITKN